MRNPRIYQNTPLSVGETVDLNDDAFGHTVRVLRLQNGDSVTLFNGKNLSDNSSSASYGDFEGELVNVSKKSAQVLIKSFIEKSGRGYVCA